MCSLIAAAPAPVGHFSRYYRPVLPTIRLLSPATDPASRPAAFPERFQLIYARCSRLDFAPSFALPFPHEPLLCRPSRFQSHLPLQRQSRQG
jgi:hypothetical protein